MYQKQQSKKDKFKISGFTLIELIVVMSILAILVLLAAPKLLGYSDKARTTQITNDIKVLETKIDEYLIEHEEFPASFSDGVPGEGQLYDRTGKIEAAPSNLKVVDKTFYPETGLGGTYYSDKDGKVIYEDKEGLITDNEDNPSIPEFPEVVVEVDQLLDNGWIPVANADELNQIRQNGATLTFGSGTAWEGQYVAGLDKNYVQVADIDLSSYGESYRGGKGWEPIGRYVGYNQDWEEIYTPFVGKYNGANFMISNLYINESPVDEGSVGLWGMIADATLSNINVKNSRVSGISGKGVGTVVGFINSYTGLNELNNIKVDNVTIRGKDQTGIVAGTVMNNTNSEYIKITNSTLEANDSWGAGLFAGYYDGGEGNYVKNIHVQGNIEMIGDNISTIGGVIGEAYSYGGLVISDIYADVQIKDESNLNASVDYIGGFAGDVIELKLLENVVINGSVEGRNYVGGVIGEIYGSNDASILGQFQNITFNGDVIGNEYVGGFVAYSESNNVHDNIHINADVTGVYFIGGVIGWNEPNNAITNASVTGNIGGAVTVGGIVGWNESNSNISTSGVTGTITGVGTDKYGQAPRQLGGIVGWNDSSTISDTYVIANISGGDSYIGGLTGYTTGGAIENSHVIGDVSGGYLVGGLTGEIQNNGSVLNSYIEGNVIGTNNDFVGVGGLAGIVQDSSIEGSHIKGNVQGVDGVGGIAGFHDHSYLSIPVIKDSYIIGDISGRNYVGGLFGSMKGSRVTNSYVTGNVTGVSNVGGLTGEALKHGNSSVYTVVETSHITGIVTGQTNVGDVAGTYVPHEGIVFTNSFLIGQVIITQ